MKIAFHPSLNIEQVHQLTMTRMTNRAKATPMAMSFPEFFTHARTQLLTRIADTISSDTYVLTRTFAQANALGFYVPTDSNADHYKSHHVLNKTIVEMLQICDIVEERPFNFIRKFIEQIKSALAHYGYKGKKDHYTRHEHQAFLSYLHLTLGESIHDKDVFIMNTNKQVIDCNWFFIRKLIWLNLITWGYLSHSSEWIVVLFENPERLDKEAFNAIFSHPEDFIQYLLAFPSLSEEQIRRLIPLYMQHCVNDDPLNRQKHLYHLLLGLSCYAGRALYSLFNVFKSDYLSELKQFITEVTTEMLDGYPQTIQLGIKLISEFSLDQQQVILMQYNYVILKTIRSNKKQIETVLNYMDLLSFEQQAAVFLPTTYDGDNLLLYALKNLDASTFNLFINLFMRIQPNVDAVYTDRILSQTDANGHHLFTLFADRFLNDPHFLCINYINEADHLTTQLDLINANSGLFINHVLTQLTPSKKVPVNTSVILSHLASCLKKLNSEQSIKIFSHLVPVSQKNLFMYYTDCEMLFRHLCDIFHAWPFSDIAIIVNHPANQSIVLQIRALCQLISQKMCLEITRKALNHSENSSERASVLAQEVLAEVQLQSRQTTGKEHFKKCAIILQKAQQKNAPMPSFFRENRDEPLFEALDLLAPPLAYGLTGYHNSQELLAEMAFEEQETNSDASLYETVQSLYSV